jgi:hypothetical protein
MGTSLADRHRYDGSLVQILRYRLTDDLDPQKARIPLMLLLYDDVWHCAKFLIVGAIL